MSILEGSVTGSVAGSLQLNGEGGTDNYNELNNKPQINGVTLIGNKNSEELFIIKDVYVNGVSVVDGQLIARITIPPTPEIPVTVVKVNGQSVMVGTEAEITIPPTPEIPVTIVKVNGQSVMVGTEAEITIPPTPTIPVQDVEVNHASVVVNGTAEIEVPVLDVKVDGASVVDENGNANITLPSVPVRDVKVDGNSVVDPDGVADITLPVVPVRGVKVDGASVVDQDGIAQITMPVIPTIPVVDVKVNGHSVVDQDGDANIVLHASDVSYDNSNSGYTASQTQDAIDEAASKISDNASDISDLQTNVGDFSTPLDTTAQDCHDAINELKQSLDDKNSIVFSGTLADVVVTSGTFVELKKVTVPTTGYYLVSGYHEWASGSSSVVYADAINGYTQRNLSKGNGGGAFVTFVCRYNANDEVVYKTYLYSGDDTTRRGYLSVVKL